MTRTRLVLLPNWMGDVVMAEPALRALHESQPEVRMIGAGRAVATGILATHPAFTELITIHDRGLLGPWSAGRTLRRVRADEVLLLRNSARSALVARRCGAPERIGYRRDGRGALLSTAIEPTPKDQPISAVHDYANLIEKAYQVEVSDRRPHLPLSPTQQERAEQLLDGLPRPIIGMVPGASKQKKRWPAEHFGKSADLLHQATGGSIVLLGSPEEAPVLAAVSDASNAPIRNLPEHGLSLETLQSVIANLDVLITNDTGPRHLAIASNTPAISLFGPTDHRWTIIPGADESMLLAEPFLDDDHLADNHPKMCRIDRIPVEDVIWRTLQALDQPN